MRTPYAIANNVKNYSFDLDVYSLDSGGPLSEPQLNVYLDIVANDKNDSYIIPLFVNISKKYDISFIVDALNRMLDVHPILGMCVSDEFDVPYLVKGSKPEVLVKSNVDDVFINDFLIKSFDLYDSLCRFLVIMMIIGYMVFSIILFLMHYLMVCLNEICNLFLMEILLMWMGLSWKFQLSVSKFKRLMILW